MKLWNQDLVVQAWNVASEAHKGQFVPGTTIPYINHIGNVAMEVMLAIAQSGTVRHPDLAVQCALLHDVLEDTESTYEELREIFGADVADGVLALTKDNTLPSKEKQMQDSLSRIVLQPKEIWMVKMADRISNLQPPPPHWTKEKIRKYRKVAMMIHHTLQDAHAVLADRLWKKIASYKAYC